MRLKLLRFFTAVGCLLIISGRLSAQRCIPTNISGTVINLLCNQVCSTLVFQVPHIKSTDDYTLTSIPYNPYPYSTPTGTELATLYADDTYSPLITLPFSFCFYGTTYPSTVVGSNGLMTFESAVAGCQNAWPITSPIPFAGSFSCPFASPAYYPGASIMAVFSDLDPRTSPPASPGDRKIQYEVFGTAPCRKFVVSYYHIGVYGVNGGCPVPLNTFQTVIHESTGLIEIFFLRKQCLSTTNGGNAIFGMQNMLRNKWISAPGKNPGNTWTETNTGYQFVPSGATSSYVIGELLDMSGNVVATADTATTITGLLDIRFPNFCTPPGSTQYAVRTRFSACDNPATILESLDTITINRTNSLNATATTTAASCGPPDGTITVTVPAGIGTPPDTFVLDGVTTFTGASPHTFTNVSSGPHTVVVTDASNGCTSTINVNVNLSGLITITTSMEPTACIGVNNGKIHVNSATGIGPYTFSLDGGPSQPGTIPYTFFNVSPGPHTVIVDDAGSGCNSGPINVTVNVGPGVTGSATTMPTTCAGNNDGQIIVTALTGTAPFTWSLDGAPVQNGPNPHTFFNVAAGIHFVTITDNLGCNVIVPNINVAAGNSITATYTSNGTACATATNGSIIITSATGSPPHTFSIDGGPFQPGTIPYTFNGLSAGLHTVLVRDATLCTSLPIPVTITAGPGVSGNAVGSPTSCPVAADGSILVTATVGFPPYTFVLDGVTTFTGASPHTFPNVSAGSHTVVITDNFNCSLTLNNIVVDPGPVLTANTTTMATTCSGATNGSITVTPVGGTSPFSFVLDGGPPQVWPAPHTFNNLTAGNHTIVVTDALGCATNTITVNVPAGPVLTTTVMVTDVLCNGGATGIITVTVPVIGTPPYEYSLDNVNWQFNNVFNGRPAGNYTVYYRESNGCQGSQPVTVAEPPVLTATSATVPAVCNGQNNGTITITAGGGVPPYQYSIDGGTNWQVSNVFNVIAGSYTVLIMDVNNCTTTQNVIVTEPPAITASSVNTNASCNGGNDGVITVTANGGNGSYQYSIDGINFQGSNVFNVAPGPYTITVKDNLGCTTTFPTTVGLGNNLTYIKQTDPTICEGTSTQLLFSSNATVYSWSPSIGLDNTTIPNPVANPTVTTQYIVTATLDRCMVEDTVIVNVNAAPVPDAGADGFICYGQTYQLQASGGVQYSWTPSTYLNNTTTPNPVSTPLQTIFYTLSIISDINGCASLITDEVMVDVIPPIKVNTFPYDTIAYPGEIIQLQAISVVPAANNYTWTPSTNLNNPNIPNPIVTAGNVGDLTVYKVTASSPAGCIGEGYVRLRVYKGPELYLPTGFSPNGDGLNDTFYPFPVGIKSINYFKVFNRWGQLLFSSQTLYKGWDGRFQGVDQPTGVYVFMAEGVDKNNNVLTRRGNITLIR